jgi:ParB-like chromosome segregation protein Spo0J
VSEETLEALLDKGMGEAVTMDIPLSQFPDEFPGCAPSETLKTQVARWGVIEPIVIVAGKVVDGKRRILAAKAAGQTTIPAKEYAVNGVRAPLVSLLLNACRSPNPYIEYEAIKAVMNFAQENGAGLTENDIRKATGMAVGTIRKRMALGGLCPALMGALQSGAIRYGLAEQAAKLTQAEQAELVCLYEEKGALTAADLHAVKQVKKAQASEALPDELFAPVKTDWCGVAVSALERVLASMPAGHPQRERLHLALAQLT